MKRGGLLLLLATTAACASRGPHLHVAGAEWRTSVTPAYHMRRPAYPVEVLEPLGAKIERRDTGAALVLYGDTLTFTGASPSFRVGRHFEHLETSSYEAEGELYLPREFFAEWLPARYGDRLTFSGDTLSVRPESGRSAQKVPLRRPPRAWSVDARVSSVYTSNVHREEVALPSYGTVARIGVGIRSPGSTPVFESDYTFRLHRYTSTTRWDRLEHDLRLTLTAPSRRVRPSIRGEVRLGSATEDKELANQYIVRPGLDVEIADRVDLGLYAVHRWKRYLERTDRNETNRYAGAVLDLELADWLEWSLEGRYEVNDGERDSRRYSRITAGTGLGIELGRSTALELEYGRRLRDHAGEMVDTLDVLRADVQSTSTVAFLQSISDRWRLRLEYELDVTDSNQLEEDYREERVELELRRIW